MTVNVALFCHSPYLQGGQKSLLETALLYLEDTDINVFTIIPRMENESNGECSLFAMNNNLKFVEGPVSSPAKNWYIYKSPKNNVQFNNYCEIIKQDINEYMSILKDSKADLIIVNTLTNLTPYFAAISLGIPIITWVRGYLDPKEIRAIDPQYQEIIDESILKISDYVIYCSEKARDKYISIIKNYNFKDSVILNYTAEPKNIAEYDLDGNVFVCLNRLEAAKGVATIVEAAEIIKDKGYDFKVNIYGDGPDKRNLQQKIRDKNLESYINIFSREIDVERIYNSSCAVLQPSHFESFGRTLIESFSYKRPVIAAKTADPVGIIQDEVSGFYINKDDYNEMAKCMIKIINNKEEAKVMGNNGYKVYKEYYDGTIAKTKLTSIINECLLNYNKDCEIKKKIIQELMQLHKMN